MEIPAGRRKKLFGSGLGGVSGAPKLMAPVGPMMNEFQLLPENGKVKLRSVNSASLMAGPRSESHCRGWFSTR
jgi:hypothetical protein